MIINIYDNDPTLVDRRLGLETIQYGESLLQFIIPWNSQTLSIFVQKKLAIINALRSSDDYAWYI